MGATQQKTVSYASDGNRFLSAGRKPVTDFTHEGEKGYDVTHGAGRLRCLSAQHDRISAAGGLCDPDERHTEHFAGYIFYLCAQRYFLVHLRNRTARYPIVASNLICIILGGIILAYKVIDVLRAQTKRKI